MTTLDAIVRSVLNEEGATTLHKYDSYLMMAFDGLQFIRLHVYGQTRSAIIDIDSDTNSVPLPGDCVRVNKLGIYNGKTIIVLNPRNRSLKKVVGEVTFPKDSQTILVDNASYFPNLLNGINGYAGAFYAQPAQSFENGFYELDMLNGVARFDTYHSDYTQCVMTYSSSDKKGYAVPDLAYETLKAWIQWRKKIDKPSITRGDKLDARHEFFEAWRRLRAQMFGLSADDINEIIRSAYMAGIKSPLSDEG